MRWRQGGKKHSHGFQTVWISLGQLLFAIMFSLYKNLTALESPERRLLALGMLYITPPASLRGKASLLRLGITDNWLLSMPARPSCVPQPCPLGPPKPLWKGPLLLSFKIKWMCVWIRCFWALDQSLHCSGSRPLSEWVQNLPSPPSELWVQKERSPARTHLIDTLQE